MYVFLCTVLMISVVLTFNGCGEDLKQHAVKILPITNTDTGNYCPSGKIELPAINLNQGNNLSGKTEGLNMWMTVNNHRFAMTLADNATARAFVAQLPLTLHMEEFNNNEKHAQLPGILPSDASRPGIIRHGDIMLYGSQTLVVFYKTFPSVYSYTRIGAVNQPNDLQVVLGSHDVEIVFSKD